MALQGTLDTFALPDVLRLLVTTRKTGRLRVSGDRGSGSIWVEEGKLTATELVVTGAMDDGTVNTLFHLLRFKRGSFIFESGSLAPASSMSPTDIEPLLAEAESLLVEWRAIEAVIPSVDAWLALKAELTGPGVKIDAGRWRLIAAIAAGRSVADLCAHLESDEMVVMRQVKELVELGLVEVGDQAPAAAPSRLSGSSLAPPPAPAAFESAPSFARDSWDEPRESWEPRPSLRNDSWDDSRSFARDSWDEPAASFGTVAEMAPPSSAELSGLGHIGLANERFESYAEPSLPPPPPPLNAMQDDDDYDDPAEIARQLANLSPRAAKAVAAAAKAQSAEEREAALAAIEAEDETVNRGLLLKFLGSVES